MDPKKSWNFDLVPLLPEISDDIYLEGEYLVIIKFNPESNHKFGLDGKLYCGKQPIAFKMSKQQVSKQSKKHFVKIHISNPQLSDFIVNYIELDAPADPNNWIDFIYLTRIGLRGTFFSFGKHDKVRNVLKVEPGAIYRIKLEATKKKKWSGSAKVTLEGFYNDQEIVSDDWIITGKKVILDNLE